MLEALGQLDQTIFNFINQSCSTGFFDAIVPWFRDRFFWTPLYVFLIVFFIVKLKQHAYIVIISAILCVMFADQLSSSFAKPFFQRERPCNSIELQDQINILAPCRQSFSFTSSHAANHFALAIFFISVLSIFSSRWRYLLLAWAALVSLSQIYVGLHYPGDILGGALLGTIIGYIVYRALDFFYLKPMNLASIVT